MNLNAVVVNLSTYKGGHRAIKVGDGEIIACGVVPGKFKDGTKNYRPYVMMTGKKLSFPDIRCTNQIDAAEMMGGWLESVHQVLGMDIHDAEIL